MINEYKKQIIDMLGELDNTDKLFLMQIYIIIKQHINKKRGR